MKKLMKNLLVGSLIVCALGTTNVFANESYGGSAEYVYTPGAELLDYAPITKSLVDGTERGTWTHQVEYSANILRSSVTSYTGQGRGTVVTGQGTRTTPGWRGTNIPSVANGNPTLIGTNQAFWDLMR